MVAFWEEHISPLEASVVDKAITLPRRGGDYSVNKILVYLAETPIVLLTDWSPQSVLYM